MIPVIAKNMPNKSEPLEAHVFFTKSLLRMIEYAPALRHDVLAIIMDGLIKIDTDIQIEIEELSPEEIQEVNDVVFALDDLISDTQMLSSTSPVDSMETFENSDSEYEGGVITSNFKEMFTKLDALMNLMIQYLSGLASTTEVNSEDSVLTSVFYSLLEIFETLILPTFRIKSVQFIIFYATSLDPSFPNIFMSTLVTQILGNSINGIAATSYLGSFIARGKHIDTSSVRKCLAILNSFSLTFCEKNEDQIKNVSSFKPERFAPLYSSIQAILYIFCFHWRALTIQHDDEPKLGVWPDELLGLQRVLISKFNPLSVNHIV